MRDAEGRKTEASKVKQTTKQSNTYSTPKAVTFPKKNELLRVGLEPTHPTCTAICGPNIPCARVVCDNDIYSIEIACPSPAVLREREGGREGERERGRERGREGGGREEGGI